MCLLAIDPSSVSPGVPHTPVSIRPPAEGVKVKIALALTIVFFQPVWEVIPMMFDCITEVSAVRIRIMDKLDKEENRDTTGKMILKVLAQMNGEPTLLCPKNDMRIPDADLIHAVDKKAELEKRLAELPITKLKDFANVKGRFDRKVSTYSVS